MSARSDYNAIWKAHNQHGRKVPHPLGGMTVREWVKDARRGWPRVPVPKDPYEAALKVAEAYGGPDNYWLESYERMV